MGGCGGTDPRRVRDPASRRSLPPHGRRVAKPTDSGDEPGIATRNPHPEAVSLTDDIRSLGGLAPTHALLARGWSPRRLAWSVRSGEIVRVRQGWYLVPDTPEEWIRAARVGGRLGCSSGASAHGLWVRTPDRSHISVLPHSSRLRAPDDTTVRLRPGSRDPVVHWTGRRPASRFIAHPLDCLLQMVECEPAEFVVAAADSVIKMGMLTRSSWTRAIRDHPLEQRVRLGRVNPSSESITESIVRFRVEEWGIPVRPQVRVGDRRVDLLIGDRLAIELEGFMFHGSRAQFEADRRRAAELSHAGLRVLVFSYQQVVEHWDEVRRSIASALARRDER